MLEPEINYDSDDDLYNNCLDQNVVITFKKNCLQLNNELEEPDPLAIEFDEYIKKEEKHYQFCKKVIDCYHELNDFNIANGIFTNTNTNTNKAINYLYNIMKPDYPEYFN